METDFVTLRVAAERLGISLRHTQRLAQKVAPGDKEVAPNGTILVRVEALSTLLKPHSSPATAIDADATKVDILSSELSAAKVALEEAKRHLEEARRDKERLYDALARTQQESAEWRRLLVASNPKLLPPPADIAVGQAESRSNGFWARWWKWR